MDQKHNIFLVEDEPGIREIEEYMLTKEGYHVLSFNSAEALLNELPKGLPDLILLDIILPGMNGLEALAKLKADVRTRRVPVIMLTAKASDIDLIRGLETGADDYVTKPINYPILLARVKALIRRNEPEHSSLVYEYKDIMIQESLHLAQIGDHILDLSDKEYDLLSFLVQKAPGTITRDHFMDELWGGDFTGESRTLDTTINRLRKKLEGSQAVIRTVWGQGYRLE